MSTYAESGTSDIFKLNADGEAEPGRRYSLDFSMTEVMPDRIITSCPERVEKIAEAVHESDRDYNNMPIARVNELIRRRIDTMKRRSIDLGSAGIGPLHPRNMLAVLDMILGMHEEKHEAKE